MGRDSGLPDLDGSFWRSQGTVTHRSGPPELCWALAISLAAQALFASSPGMGDSPHVSAHRLSLEGSPSQPPRQLSYSKTQTPTADPEIPAGAPWSALLWVEGSPVQVLEAAAAGAFGCCPEPTAGPSRGAGFRGWGCRGRLSPSRSAWPPQASFLAGLPPARFSVPHGDSLTINYPFPLKTARDGFCCNSESWPWDGCIWGVVREEAAWGPCDVFTWWLRRWRTRLQWPGFHPWVRKIPWRRKWPPTAVFLPGESHGQRSLVGYSPRGCKESDTTEWLTL